MNAATDQAPSSTGLLSRDTPYFLWCSELPGFGLRVFPTGKRVYYADYYNSGGTRKRMSIGARTGRSPHEEARKLAIAILGAVVKGDDPRRSVQPGASPSRFGSCAIFSCGGGTRSDHGQARSAQEDQHALYGPRPDHAVHRAACGGGKRVRDLVAADINRFIRDVADGKTAHRREDHKQIICGRAKKTSEIIAPVWGPTQSLKHFQSRR